MTFSPAAKKAYNAVWTVLAALAALNFAAFLTSSDGMFLDVDIKPPDPKLEANLDFKKNCRIIERHGIYEYEKV